MKSTFIAVAALAASAYAKTNLAGCTSTANGASLVWYDPTNGEICELLDCGGGRAPPKTTVPGCAAYEGTETYSPKYLEGWGEATSTAEYATAIPSATAQTTGANDYPVETPSQSVKTDITSLPLTSMATVPYPTGTGIFSSSSSIQHGNNVTATGKPTTTGTGGIPESTGAAALLGVAKGVVGLAVGVAGLAML